jgi:hypothetical protein
MEQSLYKVELWSIWEKSFNQPIGAQISQTSFDSESFEYFKIHGDLEDFAIMKSVPNCISYLHDFFRIFIPFLAIFLCEKLILGFVFNPLITARVGPTCL